MTSTTTTAIAFFIFQMCSFYKDERTYQNFEQRCESPDTFFHTRMSLSLFVKHALSFPKFLLNFIVVGNTHKYLLAQENNLKHVLSEI